MATLLTKAVSRVVEFPRLRLVVTMSPAGIFTFRESRSRRSYSTPILGVYERAVLAAKEAKRPRRTVAVSSWSGRPGGSLRRPR